jgi:hypothetical protein
MNKKDIVLETLKSLVRDGRILPEDVVEAASEVSSPIHNNFEWDDTKAAHEHRIWQARQLITYKFKVEGETKQQFYNVKVVVNSEPVQGYFTKEKVLSEREMYLHLLKEAVGEIKYWEKKYEEIKELGGVINNEKLKEVERNLEK